MANNNFSQTAAFLWSVADLLRGDFKQSQYGRIILPFTLLRRLECVLEESKAKVLSEYEKVQTMNFPEETQEKMLLRATNNLAFFNTSPLDLKKLGQSDISQNLNHYIQSFSKDAREIFDHFKFEEFLIQLKDANLLYKVTQIFANADLSPKAISNHDMGLVFEELIRRFAESSNETAGEHFTPRDIVNLTTELVFAGDDDALSKDGIIRTIYDPTAGTGGFLSSGMEYLHELNPNAVIHSFGQELNSESYAICKASILIKGQDVSYIKLGNTLSNDQLANDKFDYMLSNPPFGMDWKKIEQEIKTENEAKGVYGRFGAGLPRVSDGSLLFLQHLISKMHDTENNGSRIGIILNGSPLFTGSAGSGESEIRRYILESDLLEAIIALPTDMFYNTGISTYVWVLSNNQQAERRKKIQLINATNLASKMRKSLGSKRHYLDEIAIKAIVETYNKLAEGESTYMDGLTSKIFAPHKFGYRRVTIERPLRLSAQMSNEKIKQLRFVPKPFNAIMQTLVEHYGYFFTSQEALTEKATEIRAMIKADFTELKEVQIKNLLDIKTWQDQADLFTKAQALQAVLGPNQLDNFNKFNNAFQKAEKLANVTLTTKERDQIMDAITWKNPEAEPVVKKSLKAPVNGLYGAYEYKGKVVEFKQDGDFRDYENIPLDPTVTTTELIESYVQKEVLPHVADAWINVDKKDAKDNEIGIVGYEIPFKKYFITLEYDTNTFTKYKIKDIFHKDNNGAHIIKPTGQIISYKVLTTSPAPSQVRVKIDQSILNIDYYNFFITTEKGKLWLESIAHNTNIISISSISKHCIHLPSLSTQNEILENCNSINTVIEELKSIQNNLIFDTHKSSSLISDYRNISNMSDMRKEIELPAPLAILWQLSQYQFDEKSRIEYLCSFYENLGLFALSVIFGSIQPSRIIEGEIPNRITMAYGYNRLKNIKNRFEQSDSHLTEEDREFLKLFCIAPLISQEFIEILKEATDIRNDLAHRGIHSQDKLRDITRRLDSINEQLFYILKDFFTELCLINPINSIYRNSHYEYKVNVFKETSINPCQNKIIKTKQVLEHESLYCAYTTSTGEHRVLKLFPFIICDEIMEHTNILGFYFYSDHYQIDNTNHLRFNCPYPTITSYKYKDVTFFN